MLTRVFDVQIIPGESQVNNRRLDVTGMLAQGDGHFAQLLEGRSGVMRGCSPGSRPTRVSARCVLLRDSIQARPFSRCALGLARRDDRAEEMKTLHRDGCENNAQARRLIPQLMAGER